MLKDKELWESYENCNTQYRKKFSRNYDSVERTPTCLFILYVWAMSEHTNLLNQIPHEEQQEKGQRGENMHFDIAYRKMHPFEFIAWEAE